MKRIPVLILAACLMFASGCDDDSERLRTENERQREQVGQLNEQNRALLETQQSALGQLQDERQNAAQLAAEDRTIRNHHATLTSTLIVCACSLAACLYALWRKRGQERRDV